MEAVFEDEDAQAFMELVADRLMTEAQLARKLILDSIDPITALGDEFTFERREPSPYYISLEVPDICAQVDLIEAWKITKLDMEACAQVLEHDNSLVATLEFIETRSAG